MTTHNPLNDIRKHIDDIDQQLQSLLTERAKLALQVAAVKKQQNSAFYDPAREEAIIESIINRNQGPLSNEALEKIFRNIIAACLDIQKP